MYTLTDQQLRLLASERRKLQSLSFKISDALLAKDVRLLGTYTESAEAIAKRLSALLPPTP